MADSGNEQIAEFNSLLTAGDKDYVSIGNSTRDRAHIRFAGRFLGRDTIWDLQLVTLSAYNNRQHGPAVTQRFIEITETDNTLRPVTVCLDVDRIDEPVILKTIIMIRKYRRLHVGRHTFGGNETRTDPHGPR